MSDGAVVVVNYGSSTLLEQNLGPLGDAGRPFAVVVVDNYSSDAERERVRELADRYGWELVLEPNRGFGAGMNAGAARALEGGARSLLLLNPDVSAAPGTLTSLLAHAAAQPDDVVAPQQERPDGRVGYARGTLDLRTGATRTREPLDPTLVPWLTGACLALSADLWSRLGGFTVDYFMYWEDVDLCHRAQLAGAAMVVRDDLVVQHAVGGTQGQGKSALYHYYNCRNRLLFAHHHVPQRFPWRWLALTPRYSYRVLLRDGRRPVVRDPRLALAALRGTLAGLRIALFRR